MANGFLKRKARNHLARSQAQARSVRSWLPSLTDAVLLLEIPMGISAAMAEVPTVSVYASRRGPAMRSVRSPMTVVIAHDS